MLLFAIFCRSVTSKFLNACFFFKNDYFSEIFLTDLKINETQKDVALC